MTVAARNPDAGGACHVGWRRWWPVWLLCLVVLVPPALVRTGPEVVGFDESHRRQLLAIRPDHVFIGSSTMLSRLDVEHFQQLRPGQRGYRLGEVGSTSALWYLWFKNSLLASGVSPRSVLIFYRDTELTDPGDETDSAAARARIASHLRPDDTVFQTILNHHKSVVDRLREGLLELYPIQDGWRKAGFWLLESVALLATDADYLRHRFKRWWHPDPGLVEEGERLFRARLAFQKRMAEEIFSSDNQRVRRAKSGGGGSTENPRFDFAARLPRSFLPEMIRVWQEANRPFRLGFVRMENEPAMDGSPRYLSDRQRRYDADLVAFLLRSGAVHHDFTDDPAFRWQMYLDGGHIKPEYRPYYTEHLVRTLSEWFR